MHAFYNFQNYFHFFAKNGPNVTFNNMSFSDLTIDFFLFNDLFNRKKLISVFGSSREV
jgi:hypothetical protein